MPRAALFDGDQISPSTQPYPKQALHVVFLNCHPHNMQEKINEINRINQILVKEKGWSEVEVVLCDDSPEAVDLEILLWQRNNPGYYCHEPITGDEGLKRAFKEKVVPEGHADRLPTGGAGLRAFPTSALGGLSSAQDIIRILAGKDAEQAYIEVSSWNPGHPWWAKLAHVAHRCPAARLVFPLGAHRSGTPGEALAAWAKQVFDNPDHPPSPPSVSCNIPDPSPSHSAPLPLNPIRAIPGLLQVELIDAAGAVPQYEWVALKHHCSAGIQQVIDSPSSGGGVPTGGVPVIRQEMEDTLMDMSSLWWRMRSTPTPLRATVCAAWYPPDGRVKAKRLDFTAHPSKGDSSPLWDAVERWLPKATGRNARQAVKAWVDDFLSGLPLRGHYTIVQDAALHLIEDLSWRGKGHLRWDAFFLSPGDRVELHLTPPDPGPQNPVPVWAGDSLIGLGVAQTQRPSPFREVLGLMHRPTVLFLLHALSTGAPVSIDLEVARCVHPLAYELVAPGFMEREGSAGGMLQ